MTSKRTIKQKFEAASPLALNIATPGLLSSVQFVRANFPKDPLEPGQLEIEVQATGVYFRDCLTALGQIDTEYYGGECAGTISRVGPGWDFKPGQRVAALSMNAFSTFAYSHNSAVTMIPENMCFAEASAFPVVIVTAWYALYDIARMHRNEFILIHAAAGGTGQAAIQVAQYLGAEIFATNSSNVKKSLLISEYGIPADHTFFTMK